MKGKKAKKPISHSRFIDSPTAVLRHRYLEVVDFAIVLHHVFVIGINDFFEVIVFVIFFLICRLAVEGEEDDAFVIDGDAIVEAQLIFAFLHHWEPERGGAFRLQYPAVAKSTPNDLSFIGTWT